MQFIKHQRNCTCVQPSPHPFLPFSFSNSPLLSWIPCYYSSLFHFMTQSNNSKEFIFLLFISDQRTLSSDSSGVLALPTSAGEQNAYIPLTYAQECIQKVNTWHEGPKAFKKLYLVLKERSFKNNLVPVVNPGKHTLRGLVDKKLFCMSYMRKGDWNKLKTQQLPVLFGWVCLHSKAN